jgi:hypothetical protein
MSGTARTKAALEALFENGDQPDADDFADLIASFANIPTVISSPTFKNAFNYEAPDSSWHTIDVSADVPNTANLLLLAVDFRDHDGTNNNAKVMLRTDASSESYFIQHPMGGILPVRTLMWVVPTSGTFQCSVDGRPTSSTSISLSFTPVLYL